MHPIAIFSVVNVALLSIGTLVSIAILLLLYIYHHPITKNISIVLTCNTFLALLLCCVSLLGFHASTLNNVLNPLTPINTAWCCFSFPFGYAALCALYLSYVIQALFRLFRVVLYRNKNLQSFRLFLIAIIAQWLLSFLVALSSLLAKHIVYIPSEHNCQISLSNIPGFFALLLSIYFVPTSVILILYFYILRYIRSAIHVRQPRQNANKRDLTVLKRIVVLSLTLIILGLPTFLIAMLYWITTILVPMAYNIRDLTVVIGIVSKVIILAFLTPQIREIFQRDRTRVHAFQAQAADLNTARTNEAETVEQR